MNTARRLRILLAMAWSIAAGGCVNAPERSNGYFLGPDVAYAPVRTIRLVNESVAAVASTHDGLVVLTRQPRTLRFIPAGDSVTQLLGREGDGPGEWRSPVAIAPVADAVIVFEDRLNRFLQVHGYDSIVTVTHGDAPPRGLRPVGALDDNVHIGLMNDTPTPEPGIQAMTSALVLWQASGSGAVDTIGTVSTGKGSLVRVGTSTMSMWFDSPFHPGEAYWVLPDSSAIVLSEDGRIERMKHGSREELGHFRSSVVRLRPADLDTVTGRLEPSLREELLTLDTLPGIAGPLLRCSKRTAVVQLRRRGVEDAGALLLSWQESDGSELKLSPLRYPVLGKIVGCSRTELYLVHPGRDEEVENLVVLSSGS